MHMDYAARSGLGEQIQNTLFFRTSPQAGAWGYFRTPFGLKPVNPMAGSDDVAARTLTLSGADCSPACGIG
jgi:hypothetical protein